MKKCLFEQGDIIWLDMDPSIGREARKRRPALIVSNRFVNQTGMYFICPITSREKKYFPTRIALDERTEIQGYIETDQLMSRDLEARKAEKKEECPADILEDVIQTITELIARNL
ncbi:MAG: type II toxin-antitoxin system PemK/MazF family toxin [Erysipelotrichaceae bacterium]|nr:type II toxin-antitoxin system PemK/MazF family toxin [Erysipelotrichaceae bacterium]